MYNRRAYSISGGRLITDNPNYDSHSTPIAPLPGVGPFLSLSAHYLRLTEAAPQTLHAAPGEDN
jgi:hypothetical protein